MPKTVDVKLVTFIPEKWIDLHGRSVGDSDKGIIQYNGNNRGFGPQYTNSEDYKSYQILSIYTSDLSQNYYYEDVGRTIKREYFGPPFNAFSYEYGQESTSCLSHKKDASGSDWVRYILRGSCTNPLEALACAIDWEVKVTIHKDGTVHAYGEHDGYPNFEIYKSYDGGSWTKLYNKSHGAITNLCLGMDQSFNVTV